ncbi:MAG: DUF1353 domain-containing protein [Victivallaceae bacterium]|nr:DUF1353 domain-containing protein [Victivallaceae bacterium]
MAAKKDDHQTLRVLIHSEDKRGNVYTLDEPYGLVAWYCGKRVCVPRGFESDGASVPRFFWRFVFPSSDTRALRAAFIHDYIYRTHPYGWTKGDADRLFLAELLVGGVEPRAAYRAYIGVKYFGWWSWWKGGKTARHGVASRAKTEPERTNTDEGREK